MRFVIFSFPLRCHSIQFSFSESFFCVRLLFGALHKFDEIFTESSSRQRLSSIALSHTHTDSLENQTRTRKKQTETGSKKKAETMRKYAWIWMETIWSYLPRFHFSLFFFFWACACESGRHACAKPKLMYLFNIIWRRMVHPFVRIRNNSGSFVVSTIP